MQYQHKRIDPGLLGKIVLARFMELPFQRIDRIVKQIESSAEFISLSRWVTPSYLQGAHFVIGETPLASLSTLGVVKEREGGLLFQYHSTSYVREYLFDEGGILQLKSGSPLPSSLSKTLHRLRLINTRNQLTYQLIQAVLSIQEDFLRSGQMSTLLPLTQAEISERLCVAGCLSMEADPSRISRLIRTLSIILPSGKLIALSDLFPQPRQIHCQLVEQTIKTEKTWLAQGLIAGPMSDQAIADLLKREHGVSLLRRTVADIRRSMAIPNSWNRNQRMDYVLATEGFSSPLGLSSETLPHVPSRSGVYEIRSPLLEDVDLDKTVNKTPSLPAFRSVVYIGSAGDLRKRVGDHLRGNSGNELLHRHIVGGAAQVRFRLVSDGWRETERELYRIFYETFGARPLCNRMSP
jgi:RNA polymerase sigma-54 factor